MHTCKHTKSFVLITGFCSMLCAVWRKDNVFANGIVADLNRYGIALLDIETVQERAGFATLVCPIQLAPNAIKCHRNDSPHRLIHLIHICLFRQRRVLVTNIIVTIDSIGAVLCGYKVDAAVDNVECWSRHEYAHVGSDLVPFSIAGRKSLRFCGWRKR